MKDEIRLTVVIEKERALKAIYEGDALSAIFQPEGLALMMRDRPRLHGIGSVPKPTADECMVYVVKYHLDDERAKLLTRGVMSDKATAKLIQYLAGKEDREPQDVASDMCSAVPLNEAEFYRAVEEQRFDVRAMITCFMPGVTKLSREAAAQEAEGEGEGES